MSNIYMYMPFEKFMSLVETRTLYLSRVSAWSDYYEMKMTNHYIYSRKSYACISSNWAGCIKELIDKAIYAQSWTCDDRESVAMWEQYSKKEGVRIKADSGDVFKMLEENVKDLCVKELGEVKYSYDKEGSVSANLSLANFGIGCYMEDLRSKVGAFSYEKEYRFVAFREKIINGIHEVLTGKKKQYHLADLYDEYKKENDVVNYYFDLSKIQEVLFSPYCPQYHQKTLENICNRIWGKSEVIYKKSTLF